MENNMNIFKKGKTTLQLWLSVIAFSCVPFQAFSIPITSMEETIEAMIDAQTANVTYLIRAFGDSEPPIFDLSFSTIINEADKTFSVIADAGSMFNDAALNMEIFGAYNNGTNEWDMGSTGNWDGNTFSGIGSMLFDINPLDPAIKAGATGSWLWGLLDYRSTIKLSPTGGFSRGDIIFTVLGNDVGSVTVHDQLQPRDNLTDPIKYKWSLTDWSLGSPVAGSPGVPPNGMVFASGLINPETNTGTLNVSIPEPSSIAIFSLCGLLLLVNRRKCRH
jgi:hypothetical protein